MKTIAVTVVLAMAMASTATAGKLRATSLETLQETVFKLARAHNVPVGDSTEGPIHRWDRVQCGKDITDKQSCTSQGCLWGELDTKSDAEKHDPWCYHPFTSQCAVNGDARKNCAAFKEPQPWSKEEAKKACEAADCCWQPTGHGENRPWCFEKAEKNSHQGKSDAVKNILELLEKIERNINTELDAVDSAAASDLTKLHAEHTLLKQTLEKTLQTARDLHEDNARKFSKARMESEKKCQDDFTHSTRELQEGVDALQKARLEERTRCEKNRNAVLKSIDDDLAAKSLHEKETKNTANTARLVFEEADKAAIASETSRDAAKTARKGKEEAVEKVHSDCRETATGTFNEEKHMADDAVNDARVTLNNELSLLNKIRGLLDDLSDKKNDEVTTQPVLLELQALATRSGVKYEETTSIKTLLNAVENKIKAELAKAEQKHKDTIATSTKTRDDAFRQCDAVQTAALKSIADNIASLTERALGDRNTANTKKATYDAEKEVADGAAKVNSDAIQAAPGLRKDAQDKYEACVGDADTAYNTDVRDLTGAIPAPTDAAVAEVEHTAVPEIEPLFRRRLLARDDDLATVQPEKDDGLTSIQPIELPKKEDSEVAHPVEGAESHPISTGVADEAIKSREGAIQATKNACDKRAENNFNGATTINDSNLEAAEQSNKDDNKNADATYTDEQAMVHKKKDEAKAFLENEKLVVQKLRGMVQNLKY